MREARLSDIATDTLFFFFPLATQGVGDEAKGAREEDAPDLPNERTGWAREQREVEHLLGILTFKHLFAWDLAIPILNAVPIITTMAQDSTFPQATCPQLWNRQ